jgi:osmotically inducible lipoprotein OsmB
MRYQYLLSGLVVIVMAGCGTTPGDRALSGAGIGAGAGAAIGAVTGIGPGTGAAVGAAVGAATGGLTEKDQVDLGDPAWKKKKQ